MNQIVFLLCRDPRVPRAASRVPCPATHSFSCESALNMTYQTIVVGASAFISYPFAYKPTSYHHTHIRQPVSKSTFGQTSPIPPSINYPSVSSFCCMDVKALANQKPSRILRSVCFASSVPRPPTGSVSSSLHLL
jgi:hypothetical protein